MPTPVDTVPPPDGSGLGLHQLLNILWRWRWLVLLGAGGGAAAGVVYGWVVTPLYRGHLTVEPGITFYNQAGIPEREWEVQDIVQWYRRGDYNPELARELDRDPARFRPIIRASFIPRSPQSRGGRTISLTTLSADPDEARAILAGSVRVFNRFAEADSVTANIALMRARVRANIAREQAKIEQVETERSRLDLQIEATRADIAKTEAERSIYAQKIAELEASRAAAESTLELYESVLDAVSGDVAHLKERLDTWEAQADAIVREMGDGRTLPADPTATLLLRSESAQLVGTVGELRLGLLDQNERKVRWRERTQELHKTIAGLDAQIAQARFDLEQELPRRILELGQKITEFELKRDRDLAREELDRREELGMMRARLAALTPLQAIGEPSSSARPVRPRKRRAILILFGLGLAGGLAGAYVLEYLSENWRRITQPAHRAG